jgi:hypothetical protein
MAAQKVKYRIGGAAAFFMLFIAGSVDLITLIPLVGTFIGWIFWIFFSMYMVFSGIGLRSKNIITGGISTIIELVPGLQMLPSITTGVLMIIFSTRAEDKIKSKLNKPLTQNTPQSNAGQDASEEVPVQ